MEGWRKRYRLKLFFPIFKIKFHFISILQKRLFLLIVTYWFVAIQVDEKMVKAALIPFGDISEVQIPLDYQTGRLSSLRTYESILFSWFAFLWVKKMNLFQTQTNIAGLLSWSSSWPKMRRPPSTTWTSPSYAVGHSGSTWQNPSRSHQTGTTATYFYLLFSACSLRIKFLPGGQCRLYMLRSPFTDDLRLSDCVSIPDHRDAGTPWGFYFAFLSCWQLELVKPGFTNYLPRGLNFLRKNNLKNMKNSKIQILKISVFFFKILKNK